MKMKESDIETYLKKHGGIDKKTYSEEGRPC